jgi:Asp/Glu/hydantoin racemase
MQVFSPKPIATQLICPQTTIKYWTSPTGPSVIKTQEELNESAIQSISHLVEVVDDYDGFMIACYGDALITRLLQEHVGRKPVVSIFEASITTAMQLLRPGKKFG